MLFATMVPLSLLPVREYGSASAYGSADAPGTYVHYDWPSSHPLSQMMRVDHVWTSIPSGSETVGNGVFASSQMWWHAANGTQLAGGYMGSQVMRNGDEERRVFIFSCWDHSPTNRVGWTTPATCARFGGEGVGSHCILDYKVMPGVLYNFTLKLSGHNATGAFWSGVVEDTSTYTELPVGTLFLPHVDGNIGYGSIGVNSNMFLEYFLGGDCDEAVHVGVGLFGPVRVPHPLPLSLI
jgi:hypothetical protein